MKKWGVHFLIVVVTAAATAGLTALLVNIQQRKLEARDRFVRLVELDESVLDAAVWGRNFPREYDGWLRTSDTNRTRYGGSEAFSHLDAHPQLRTIYAGYPFGVDYREERGHMYSLADQKLSLRTQQFNQPGACLHCHAGGMAHVYRTQGQGDLWVGFTNVCRMPLTQAWDLVQHPVTCVDCHDPKTMALRISRPGFLAGIAVLAASDAPVPSAPSIERWRAAGRKGTYDPNREASRQEMRSMVCAQCHVEYYFKGAEKLVTFPWHRGLKVEDIEAYYDAMNYADWTHAISTAKVLKAQHPEYELWNQGIHARSGVACADCHMPYKRDGAMKISDHHIRSPVLNIRRACLTCHHVDEDEMRQRVEAIQTRTRQLLDRAMDTVAELIQEIGEAQARGVPEDAIERARAFQRQAQWRVDFISSENSMGFHAPQEAARILAEAIDFAQQGRLVLVRAARAARTDVRERAR